jgi:hypothetical protein
MFDGLVVSAAANNYLLLLYAYNTAYLSQHYSHAAVNRQTVAGSCFPVTHC